MREIQFKPASICLLQIRASSSQRVFAVEMDVKKIDLVSCFGVVIWGSLDEGEQ